MLLNTDHAWQAMAQTDPYWAVLTSNEFRSERLNEAELRRFFQSGQNYVDWVFSECESHVVAPLHPRRALDFGCGVGRLALPLAQRCEQVCAVDIAQAMIDRGRVHARENAIENISWYVGPLTKVPTPSFDFVHSFIVLQHIPVPKGMAIVAEMLARLEPGGIGVIHIAYLPPPRRDDSFRLLGGLRNRLGYLYNRMRGWFVPEMQMNPYPLNAICGLLQEHAVRRFHVHFTDHGTRGVVLMFQKTPGAAYPEVLNGYS